MRQKYLPESGLNRGAPRVGDATFRAFSNRASAAIFIYHSHGFIYSNPAMCALTGYAKKELASMTLAEIAHPDLRGLVQKRELAWQQGEPLPRRYEMKILTKSGQERWLDVSSSRLDVHGTLAAFGVAIDITGWKRQEGQLQSLVAQLHFLAAKLQTAREEERANLAREIHDRLGQALTAIKIDLGRIFQEFESTGRPPLNGANSILKLVDQTILDVRRIATGLSPGALSAAGLPAAIEWATNDFQDRTRIKCHMQIQEEGILQDQERATALFRIFQEALTNVARHSSATELYVRLGGQNGRTVLEVCDNGVGIGPELVAGAGSVGILGMRERALALGGRLEIVGRPNEGTTVRVSIPDPCARVGA